MTTSTQLVGSVYGYARVSTSLASNRQSLRLQTQALKAAGCTTIAEERVSGASTKRPELQHLVDSLTEGDTLVVWKLDRLGRSLSHLTGILDLLDARGVNFVSLTEAIDTRTSTGRLLFGVLASIAAFERNLIAERVKAGLAASKMKNGRPKALTADNVRLIKRMREEKVSVPSIAKQFSVSRQTIYSALKDPAFAHIE